MKENETIILEKIQKLLNLANPDNNGSEGEIQTAFNMAQKLLRKHHLSMSQVLELDENNSTTTDFFELKESETVKYVANILPKWMATLIKSVNTITETKTLIKRSSRSGSAYGNLSIVFVGDSLDVVTSIELFNFLKDTVSKLATAHANQYEGKHKYWRSFTEGCTDRIYERSKEIEEQFDEQLNRYSPLENLDVEDREIEEEDEEFIEPIDEEFEEQLKNQTFSIELYNKYKENKLDKIKEYIEQIEAENEKVSSRSARIEVNSFEQGQEAGEGVPLSVARKLHSKNKRR